MQKEQGLIEEPKDMVPIFQKFIQKGNSKALILTPKHLDLSDYLTELESNGFKLREYNEEVKDPKSFDDSIEVWYGNPKNISEFMLLFGDKLTVFLINTDFDSWIDRVKELNIPELIETNKSQFAIMYDELYSETRKGQVLRDAVGTMTTLLIHLNIKEKNRVETQSRVTDKVIQEKVLEKEDESRGENVTEDGK